MSWALLRNSLLVSGTTTLCSCLLGFGAALWMLGLPLRWRRLLLFGVVLPLALPPFLVVDCWLHFLGLTGLWRSWFPLNIYSIPGTVWVLTLLSWPITTLAVLSSWSVLNASHLEADPALTGSSLLRWLLWPMARPALALAAPLTFVLALNNFAVPAILQVKVLPAEIWVRFSTRLDQSVAWNLSWPLIIASLLLVVCCGFRTIRWPRHLGPATAAAVRRQLGPGWNRIGGAVTVVLLVFSVVLPLGQLVSGSATWFELRGTYLAGQAALLNSFWFAGAAATAGLVLALVGSRFPLGFLFWLPLLVPGVLMGVGLIFLFNRDSFDAFYQSSALVILALAIRYLAVPWTGLGRAARSIDPTLVNAVRIEGGSRWQVWRHAHWPQIAVPAATAWYFTYLLCLWDVETIVLIVPPGGETAALRVFNLLHYGHTGQVNALCLLLLLLGIGPLLLWGVGRFIRGRLAGAAERRNPFDLAQGRPFRLSTDPGFPVSSLVTNIEPVQGRIGFGAGLWLIVALAAGLCGCTPSASEAGHSNRFFGAVEIIGSRGTALGQFNKPRSVAVDARDNLYVVDMTGRVQKFSPRGVYLGFWQMPETDKGKPKGMGVDQFGNIMILEPHYSRVSHFTPEGVKVAMWGRHGTGGGELAFPRALATSSTGDIFVSEYGLVERVQRFSTFGTNFLRQTGRAGSGPGEFNRPEGLGIDSADRLYVADSCNHRVQVLSPDGAWIASFGRPGKGLGEMSYPYDVRIDAAGYQFVCEFGNSRIQIFDANHQPMEIFGRAGAKPGEFNNPWSIALDSQGNVYVADAGNHRVQKLIRK